VLSGILNGKPDEFFFCKCTSVKSFLMRLVFCFPFSKFRWMCNFFAIYLQINLSDGVLQLAETVVLVFQIYWNWFLSLDD